MLSTQSSGQDNSQQLKSFHQGKVQSLEIIYLQSPSLNHPNLFNYDEENPIAKKLILKDSAVLAITKDNKFCLLKKQFLKDKKIKPLLDKIEMIFCSLTLQDNYYLLEPINHPLAKSVWIDIGSIQSKFFPLRKNDIIRLGSKILAIKQLVTHDQKVLQQLQSQQKLLKQILNKNEQLEFLETKYPSEKQMFCKICKNKGQLKNPLLLPCKCKLNQSYIHFQCLKNLFKETFKIKTNPFSFTIEYSSLRCSTCNEELKNQYKLNQKSFRLYNLPRPIPPYLILKHQQVRKDEEKQKQILLEIIPLSKNQSICLGNSSKSHICFEKQKTVENVHCQLVYDSQTKKFLLTDLTSKFGTLIKVQQSLKIRPQHQNLRVLRVQIGNIALDFTVNRFQTAQKNSDFDQSEKLFEKSDRNNLQNQDFSLFI